MSSVLKERAVAAVQPPPEYQRLTVDLESAQHQDLRRIAFEHQVAVVSVLRAMVDLLISETELRAEVMARAEQHEVASRRRRGRTTT